MEAACGPQDAREKKGGKGCIYEGKVNLKGSKVMV
jgi:hypothetical protein